MKAAPLTAAAIAIALLAPTGAGAAAPDGQGIWADTVISSKQGVRKDGSPVIADRSNPLAALGVPENRPSASLTFFSLGVDDPRTPVKDPGMITLGFDNLLCDGEGSDLLIEENTGEPYTPELVDVFAGPTTDDLVKVADDVNKDASVDFAGKVNNVHVVKLVDQTTSLPNNQADGYDVDGVRGRYGAGSPACGTFSGTGRAFGFSGLTAADLELVQAINLAVSNQKDVPCADDSAKLSDPTVGLGPDLPTVNPKTIYSSTDADPGGMPGCKTQAGAESATIVFPAASGPKPTLRVKALEANAASSCDGAGNEVLTGSSSTAEVTLPNGTTQVIGAAPQTIELPGLATISFNRKIMSAGGKKITQRAIQISLADTLVGDIIIGEATANYEGRPCAT